MLLDISLFGDPFLRTRARRVDVISEDVKEFINNMLETVNHSENRIGLAATQVNKDLRIFIICPMEVDDSNNITYEDPIVFINPTISNPSKEMCTEPEGCLSFPGVYGKVTRPCSITVEYQTVTGKAIKKDLKGYAARQVMHENDHLNGVLFIDRMAPKDKRKLEKELRLIKKKIK